MNLESKKGINVLSMFNGMNCGRIALERAGILVNKYHSAETDKFANIITQKNYPDTIQLGDVCGVVAKDLPKVDLLLAGSPCQGFSFAGKQLAFDDPRSALFFEFIRLLRELKPKYFLLENVRMKQEYIDVITEEVSFLYPAGGIYQEATFFDLAHRGCLQHRKEIVPVLINSSLVSAQNRQRLYWTNIPNVTQPEDKGIILKDVLEDYTDDVYLAGEKLQKNYKGGSQLNPNYKSQANTIHDVNKKSGTICAGTHGYANGYVTGAWRGRYNKDGSTTQKLELRRDDKTNSLTTVQKDNVVVDQEMNWRKLTPLECERLQTVPDNYTTGVSDTQRYKMLGNGWTVDVISHILSNIK